MKMTPPLERVLRVFLENPDKPRYGYELMKEADLPAGTLYPMLARLTSEQLLQAELDAPNGNTDGRPPRRYYRITAKGTCFAHLELTPVPSVRSGS